MLFLNAVDSVFLLFFTPSAEWKVFLQDLYKVSPIWNGVLFPFVNFNLY